MNKDVVSRVYERVYQISYEGPGEGEAPIYSILGWVTSSSKDKEEIMASVVKAGRGDYSVVRLPMIRFDDSLIKTVQSKCQSWGLRLQICLPISMEVDESSLDYFDNLNVEFSFLILDIKESSILKAIYLAERYSCYFDLLVTKKLRAERVLKLLPPVIQDRLFLEFPKGYTSDFLNCREIAQWVQVYNQGTVCPKPLRRFGLDVYDDLISPSRNMEPDIAPCYQQQSSKPDIRVSIVIPSYNNIGYLQRTVRNLILQNLDSNYFEVVVVDDGSDDNTIDVLRGMIENLTKPVNIQLIYFPRALEREMGDNNFRAGVARNLGVKNSSGEILLFLDSDIVLPADYLESLLSTHLEYDVILPHRLQLTEKASFERTSYQSVVRERDTYRSMSGYWESFQENSIPWGERKVPWKYVSTFCLSIKRSHFSRAGWFRKVFTSYGFEDTDLGFRLYFLNLRFHLSSRRVYHFYHDVKRSEYSRSERVRHKILSKSAKIFFRQYLDRRIYLEFKYYIDSYKFFGINFTRIFATIRSIYYFFRSSCFPVEEYYWDRVNPRVFQFYSAVRRLLKI